MNLPIAAGLSVSEALVNTVVGFGIVFLTLLFLSGVISLFRFVGRNNGAGNQPAPGVTAKAAPAEAESKKPADPDEAVVAVIMAAVAEKCGSDARVVSITKSEK